MKQIKNIPKLLDGLTNSFEKQSGDNKDDYSKIAADLLDQTELQLADTSKNSLAKKIEEDFIPGYVNVAQKREWTGARKLPKGTIPYIVGYGLLALLLIAILVPAVVGGPPMPYEGILFPSLLFGTALIIVFIVLLLKLSPGVRVKKQYDKGLYKLKKDFVESCLEDGVIDRSFPHVVQKHTFKNILARNGDRFSIPIALLVIYLVVAIAYFPSRVTSNRIRRVLWDSRTVTLNWLRSKRADNKANFSEYLMNLPKDPFNPGKDYSYIEGAEARQVAGLQGEDPSKVIGILYSFGPDRDDDKCRVAYDGNKGLRSNGDIVVWIVDKRELESLEKTFRE